MDSNSNREDHAPRCTCTRCLHGRGAPTPAAPAPTVVTLANITPERVTWLWPGRLPLGKLVVIDGDPSTGKSTLSLDLASRVSTGSAWPDGADSRGPAGVLLLSAEDGVADTIVPRLTAAGADLALVHVLADVPSVDEDGEVRQVPPSLPRDIPTVEKIVTEKKVALVVVDVLMAYLGKVDSHKDQEIRGVLHQLAVMAERTDCTIVLIRHLNKAGGSNALYRGGGSIGIVGAARAAYLVARDPDDEARRIFAVTKCNLATEPPSLAYRLVGDDALGCARIQWEDGPVEHTAASLLRGPVDEEERTERDEAADWLIDYLVRNGGQAPRKDVLGAARAARYSEATLKRAKDRAGVTHVSGGFPRQTMWLLPPVGSPSPGQVLGEPNDQGEPTGVDLRKHTLRPVQPVQSAQPSASEPTEPSAACGHPLSAVTTDTGRCGHCIADRVRKAAS